MSLQGADIRITDKDDASFGYVFDQTQPAVLHTATSPNVPLNAAMSTPTQPGGQYDVRDTEGDKAITHLDWVQGGGQKTLDSESSVYSRYLESSYVDVSTKGQLKLLHPMTNRHVEKTIGPIFSAAGKLWFGSDVGSVVGGLTYSSDGGANWSNATINGTASNEPIRSFCTDGTKVYFCHSTGSSTGIWVNTAAAPGTFDKFGGTPTTAAIEAIAYNGGLLYAAEIGGAGLINTTTGVYTQATPAFLNTSMVTVGLVSAANSVFWVLSQNGRSYIYKLSYDPVASVMLCEQYAEFPAGFIATCAVGYLGNVDVGGYFESSIPGVGKGTVYRVAGGMSSLLFEIGDLPEDTAVPGDPLNDNRIVAACNGSKNEYFLTTRSCYRWDVDDGGHSHVFDYPGIGTLTGGERRVPALPTGGTVTTEGAYTVHTFTASGTLAVPSGANFPAQVLVVAGGGGGSSGGGGAGGYLTGAETLAGSMTVTIGAGGAGQLCGAASGSSGGDSVFGTRTSALGGGGGNLNTYGVAGGSGGGGGSSAEVYTYGGAAGPSPAQGGSGGPNGGYILGRMPAGGGGGGSSIGGTPPDNYHGGNGGSGVWFYGRNLAGGGGGGVLTDPGQGGWATAGGGNGSFLAPNGAGQNGAVNTGGGGGGACSAQAGGNGGSGVVVIIYLTADAARTIGSMSLLTRPSVAYEKGGLYAPYAEAASVKTLTITGNTQASPTIVTTGAHGIANGVTEVVYISGSNSNPLIDGFYLATYVSPTTFSIPVNVATAAGTAGTVVYNHDVGYAAITTSYNPTGWITQSPTTFHTGSMMKDFRYISIAHDPLPSGSYLLSRWVIDGVATSPATGTQEVAGIGLFATGVANGAKETRFAIDSEGYSIETTLLIARDTTGTITPVVKGVNVVWNFVKNKKHTYSLDCRSGANAGRWGEDPLAALKFLYATANERASFEDRFAGVYQGAIESVEFTPAPISLSEGPSGIAKIVVREEG